jgi:hypothetical protein
VLKYKTVTILVIQNVSALSAACPATIETLKTRTLEVSAALSQDELQKAMSSLLLQ